MAHKISLLARIMAFWGCIQKNKKLLTPTRAIKKSSSKREREVARAIDNLQSLAQEIHPKMRLRVFPPREKGAKVTLFITIKNAIYLYYIKLFMSIVMPQEISTWCDLVLDRGELEAFELPTEVLYMYSRVYAYFSEDNPTELNLYSELYDLHNPKIFYECKEVMRVFYGEPFVDIFLENIQVVEPQKYRGMNLRDLYVVHYFEDDFEDGVEQNFFPPIPFSPIHNPCSYEGNDADGLRNKGSIGFPALIDEAIFRHGNNPKPNLQGLAEAGIELYSIYFHYPNNIEEAKRAGQKALNPINLDPNGDNLSYVIGSGEAGREGDVWALDLLVADPELMLETLKRVCRNLNTTSYLVRHNSQGEESVIKLFDVDELTLEEMGLLGVAPEKILERADKSKALNQQERLIQARAYNQMGTQKLAIKILENDLKAGYKSRKLYSELGLAYYLLIEKHEGREQEYAQRSLSFYQQSLDVDEQRWRNLSILASICFEHYKLIPNAYELGLKYLQEFRQYETYSEQYKDVFYNFAQSLSCRDLDELSRVYHERFGEPTFSRDIVHRTGHKFELLFYQANNRSKHCHYIVTRGVSSTILANALELSEGLSEQFLKHHSRVEFVIAIPDSIPLEKYGEHFTWVDVVCDLSNTLLIAAEGRILLESLDKHLLNFESSAIDWENYHPYKSNASFRFMVQPPKIFRSRASIAPIIPLESSEPIHFIGITPMYDVEHHYFKSISNKRSASSFWTLSPIFDTMRAPLVSEPENEEIDFDSLMFTQGLDHISD